MSLADPYCVGLLKLHNQQRKPYLFNVDSNHILREKSRSLSILNRFSFTSELEEALGNFTLLLNGQPCSPHSVDEQYLDHYNVDVFKRECEHIKVAVTRVSA